MRVCTIAIAVLFLATGAAHATENGTALTCKGTSTLITKNNYKESEPISMGVIIKDNIVYGFAEDAEIGFKNGVIVFFQSANYWDFAKFGSIDRQLDRVFGHIDRVTGDASITVGHRYPKHIELDPNFGLADRTEYQLNCKPTQQMF